MLRSHSEILPLNIDFFFFLFAWNVQIQDPLILLPSAAVQVHLQLEIGGWCKTDHQNHNCHGNCLFWQQILQTHRVWNTERITWWLSWASCEVVWWKSERKRHWFIWKSYAWLFGCKGLWQNTTVRNWNCSNHSPSSLVLVSFYKKKKKNKVDRTSMFTSFHIFETNVTPWERWQPSKRSHQPGLRHVPTQSGAVLQNDMQARLISY